MKTYARLRARLPYPPSTNTAYANVNNRRVKTKAAREYTQAVQAIIIQHPDWVPLHLAANKTATFTVEIIAHPPDNRRRDLANLEKIPMDAIFTLLDADDSQVTHINMIKEQPRAPGHILITIEANP